MSGAELCAIFEELGLDDVASFRTSGNLVFEAPRDMTAQIEKALESALGYDVGVFLRTARELEEIVSHEPFKPAQVKASKGKLQVSMLSAKPTAAKRKQVLALATDQDLLAFGKRELSGCRAAARWSPRSTARRSTGCSGRRRCARRARSSSSTAKFFAQ